MSAAIPQATTPAVDTAGPTATGHLRRRRSLVAVGALIVLVASAVAAVALSHPFSTGRSDHGVSGNSDPTALATVREGPLSSQVNASGTLEYAAREDGSSYSVINQASGDYTALPSAGQVIRQGQALYRVADNPVVLLNGNTPAYRSISEGDSGPDVRELNADLVALGYATRSELDPTSDYFSSETAYALEQLQEALAEDETGSLNLGQAVFLAAPLRITTVTATVGTSAGEGTPIAQASSTARQVQVNLDASQQSSVRVGDRAQITLPDNQVTPGVVSRIGTVASTSGTGSSGSSSSSVTIPIYITLRHPRDAGRLDQAPVQVTIITAGIQSALIVPVNALLAQPGGRYAVETADARGVHRLAPVTVGMFDDADGLVQVSGNLTAGEQVVVPAT
jgi:hypothetical protein